MHAACKQIICMQLKLHASDAKLQLVEYKYYSSNFWGANVMVHACTVHLLQTVQKCANFSSCIKSMSYPGSFLWHKVPICMDTACLHVTGMCMPHACVFWKGVLWCVLVYYFTLTIDNFYRQGESTATQWVDSTCNLLHNLIKFFNLLAVRIVILICPQYTNKLWPVFK